MSALMKVKLVPLLHWIQVGLEAEKTDFVAVFTKGSEDNESAVCLEKRTKGFMHESSEKRTCFGEELHTGGSSCNRSNDSVSSENQVTLDSGRSASDVFSATGDVRSSPVADECDGDAQELVSESDSDNQDCSENNSIENNKLLFPEKLCSAEVMSASVEQITERAQDSHSNERCERNSDQEETRGELKTTNTDLPAEPEECRGVFQSLICDKTNDLRSENGEVWFAEHGLAWKHTCEAVTVREKGEARYSRESSQSNESCDESDGKSCWKSGGECKHKHPVVPATHCVRLPSIDDPGTLDNEFHMSPSVFHTGNVDSDNTANEANQEFISSRRGVVSYCPVLDWQVTIGSAVSWSDQEEREFLRSCADYEGCAPGSACAGPSCSFEFEADPSRTRAPECAKCSALDCGGACDGAPADHRCAVSTKHKSVGASDSSKSTDESVDDSAAGLKLLPEDVLPNIHKYTESRNVKGAIIDNNRSPKSPRCPCCFIAADGPSPENESVVVVCALHAGCKPNSESDMTASALKQQEECSLVVGQTAPLLDGASSNISGSYYGNSRSWDDEEAPIARKGVVFCADDQLLSGEENEGMPHVDDTADSRSSCYGIQRPRAAPVLPANAKAKLSGEKTAQTSLQLQVVTGKSKLSPGTSALKQTQSEGNKDTSSPISSDALNSASAGPALSYAAVLRGSLKAEQHRTVAGEEASRPASAPDGIRSSSRQTGGASSPTREATQKSGESSATSPKMGNQNSAGATGDRSRTPMLGRRKTSTQGLFRQPSASVPVTPAGTPASIRSEKVGFFRKFRRNKNRSRSGSMASINSLSSCASSVSHSVPSRGWEDRTSSSRNSQCSSGSLAGEVVLDMAASAPSPTAAEGAAPPPPPHAFRQQTTTLQPISERPNEMFSARVNNRPETSEDKHEALLVGRLPDHIRSEMHDEDDVSLLRHSEGATGSNLTLTDDGSEYLTASEPDVNRPVAIEGFNCHDYLVSRASHSGGIAHTHDTDRPGSHGGDNRLGQNSDLSYFALANSANERETGQTQQPSHKGALEKLTSSIKRNKSDKQRSNATKTNKNPSKTYAAVLGTGLFVAGFEEPADNKNVGTHRGTGETHKLSNSSGKSSRPAATVIQTADPQIESRNQTSAFPKSFADAVNTPPIVKRVVQPPRGPFGDLTRRDSGSSLTDNVSGNDPVPPGSGLHGKLPITVTKQEMKGGQKPVVREPTIKVLYTNAAGQQSTPAQSSGASNIRPKTFATVAGQGSAKSQIGVKTVPGGNAGSPATTPDGPGGVACHTLPRSSLSPAGSAPALGVCGARLRAAKAHSIQQLNASKSPPVSPVKVPETCPFSEETFSSPQAKSMPQLAGRMVVSRDDITLGLKVSSEGNVRGRYESSSLPRPSRRSKAAMMPKLLSEIQPGKFSGNHITDSKLSSAIDSQNDTSQTSGKAVSMPMKVVFVKEGGGDKMRRDRADMKPSAHRQVGGSVAQKLAAEKTGSLHTYPQHKGATKSDSKLAVQEQIPVTQPLLRSGKPDTESHSRIRVDMSRVPVLAQKAGPQQQGASADAVARGGGQNLPFPGEHQTEEGGPKPGGECANKVSSSSPGEQQSVPDKKQPGECAVDQQETKHASENANTSLRQETVSDTRTRQRGSAEGNAQGEVIRKPPHDETIALPLRGTTTLSSVSNPQPGETRLSRCTPGQNFDHDSEETAADTSFQSDTSKTVGVEKQHASAVSTTGNSKQPDVPERLPQRDTVSVSSRTVEAPANTIASQDVPEPNFLVTEGKSEDQGEPLVGDSHEDPGAKPADERTHQAPQSAIDHFENVQQKPHVEHVPVEHVELSVNSKEQHLESATGDEKHFDREEVSEMGSGESKERIEDERKRSAAHKTVQPKKKSAQKTNKDDHDGPRDEKKRPVSSATQQEEVKTLGTVLATGDSAPVVATQVTVPRPPPRAHKANSQKSRAPSAPEAVSLSKVAGGATSGVGSELTPGTNVQHEPSPVEASTKFSSDNSERSDVTQKTVAESQAGDLPVKPEVNPARENLGVSLGKQAGTDSTDAPNTAPDVFPQNMTVVDLDCGVGHEEGNTSEKAFRVESFGIKTGPDSTADSKPNQFAPHLSAHIKKADETAAIEVKNETKEADRDSIRNHKQEHKQQESVDKQTVNIAECRKTQVLGADINETEYSIALDNDTYPSPSQASDQSWGSKPKIFDEMISVKDVSEFIASSSSCSSLELDEKIENDVGSVENCEASPRSSSSQAEPSTERALISEPTDEVLHAVKADGLVPKIKVSIEQPAGSPHDALPPADPTDETKIITEEEVTFTIDIPAGSALPLPEVNEYVSATCVAVTRTSGTVNTTNPMTSVSDGRVLQMSDPPRATAPASSGAEAAVSTHHQDETAVNICIDRGLSSVGAPGGSAGVKVTGREGDAEKPSEAVCTSGEDRGAHSAQMQDIPGIERTNEASNDEMELNIEAGSGVAKDNGASTAEGNLNVVAEPWRTGEGELVEHVEPISCKARADAQSGRQEAESTYISGGKHLDKHGPNDQTMEQHVTGSAAGTVDPIALSKPSERETTHSAVIAPSSGGGYDPANVCFAVDQITVVSTSVDTASKNTLPQIAITTEISDKDSLVENSQTQLNLTDANVGGSGYLAVDDHLGGRGAESDSSSIGRLIHSSEGEHSDMNLDDIVVRNMADDYNGVIQPRTKALGRFNSTDSSECDESDEVSSVQGSDSDFSEDSEGRTGTMRRRDHVNDADLPEDFCDKPKAKGTKERIEDNVEQPSSGKASDSENEKTKKCVVDDVDHGEVVEKPSDDYLRAKLENTGHRVGEAYFVTRRRKRAKMVDRETLTPCVAAVQCPDVCDVATDTFDSVLISSSGSSDTSPSRVQWEDDSVDDLDAARFDDAYSDEWDDAEYDSDSDSLYSDEDDELGAAARAAGPVRIIYSRPRPEGATHRN